MKKFDIPEYYRSSFVSRVKELRAVKDPKRQDYSPSLLDFGRFRLKMARHFGFCYGVERAIEIAYRTVDTNPGSRLFLLSQMIHNPEVNADLELKGVKFIFDNEGRQLLPWDSLGPDDLVIIPAFGSTVEIEKILRGRGIDPGSHTATCPFVVKVWTRAIYLGEKGFTVVIHGKHRHEETRATFSQSTKGAPAVVIRDLDEAEMLASFITGRRSSADFYGIFKDRYSEGFDVVRDLKKIGVVNQTTMLAKDTRKISEILKAALCEKYGSENLADHFADTRDTLCYATQDNQKATYGLLSETADIAIVVGGYNSSNTSHIVELLEGKFRTFFISSAGCIAKDGRISHYSIKEGRMLEDSILLSSEKPDIIITSGASCPDSMVERVIRRLLDVYPGSLAIEDTLKSVQS